MVQSSAPTSAPLLYSLIQPPHPSPSKNVPGLFWILLPQKATKKRNEQCGTQQSSRYLCYCHLLFGGLGCGSMGESSFYFVQKLEETQIRKKCSFWKIAIATYSDFIGTHLRKTKQTSKKKKKPKEQIHATVTVKARRMYGCMA